MLVYRPEDSSKEWPGEALQRLAAAVPGAVLVDDPGGVEATRFGLETSGTVAVFDPEGRLRFSGGLTRARGIAEPSSGNESLIAVVSGRRPEASSCPTFGCPLSADRKEGRP